MAHAPRALLTFQHFYSIKKTIDILLLVLTEHVHKK